MDDEYSVPLLDESEKAKRDDSSDAEDVTFIINNNNITTYYFFIINYLWYIYTIHRATMMTKNIVPLTIMPSSI